VEELGQEGDEHVAADAVAGERDNLYGINVGTANVHGAIDRVSTGKANSLKTWSD